MNTRSHWLPIAISVVASTVNAGLFTAAKTGGLFEGVASARGQPVTIGAVLTATQLAIVGAILVRLALRYLVRSRVLARRTFLAISAAVLLASFAIPVVGLSGERWPEVVVLNLMHVVSAAAALVTAELAARPRWRFGSDAYTARAISPRTALVTGATSGIGAEVAVELARRGFCVFGVGRDPGKAAKVMERAKGCEGSIVIGAADLTLESGIERAAASAAQVSGPAGFGLVVHCAGVLKPRSATTAEGIDENFAASFLARWRLHGRLCLAPGYRLINVGAAERTHLRFTRASIPGHPSELGRGLDAHGLAQFANDVWVGSLISEGVAATAYGPGAVDTAIRREIPQGFRMLLWPVFVADTRPARDAALDIVRLALDASLPSSGFADRDGFFKSPAFTAEQSNHSVLVALCRKIAYPPVNNGLERTHTSGERTD